MELRLRQAEERPAEREGEFGIGDVWTFTAICADTKLNVSFVVGPRAAHDFMQDVAGRLAGRAFSKKVENHWSAVALHFMHYNFCRIHGSLRITPAMAAGIASHPWTVAELVRLLNPVS